MKDVVVRKVNEKDLNVLTNLFYEFYTKFNMQQTLKGDVRELLKVKDSHGFSLYMASSYLDIPYITYVAEINNKLIGYISGYRIDKKHYIYSSEFEIIDWFVTEEYRGQGIGRKLYDAILDFAKLNKIKVIKLEVFFDNKKTIEIYERMGFVKDSLVLKKILS